MSAANSALSAGTSRGRVLKWPKRICADKKRRPWSRDAARRHFTWDEAKTNPHVVEGDADALGEVLAEQRDFGVTLTEMVQHDEVGVHLHAHADGLRRGAAGENHRSSGAFGDFEVHARSAVAVAGVSKVHVHAR